MYTQPGRSTAENLAYVNFLLLRHPQMSAVLVLAATFATAKNRSKGRFTGAPKWKSALRTTVIGGLAAGAAYAIAKAIA